MGNMKDIMINSCYFTNPRCTLINVGVTHSDKELEKVIPAIRQSMKGIG